MERKTKQTILSIGGIVFAGLTFIIQVKPEATVAATGIAAMPWNESNITTLRSAEVAEVEKFVNSMLCDDEGDCSPFRNVRQFTWADLEGNGKYALATVWNNGTRGEALSIYEKNFAGKGK